MQGTRAGDDKALYTSPKSRCETGCSLKILSPQDLQKNLSVCNIIHLGKEKEKRQTKKIKKEKKQKEKEGRGWIILLHFGFFLRFFTRGLNIFKPQPVS